MFKNILAKKKNISPIERYAALIFYIVTDIKNIDNLVQIYEFSEMVWKKEKKEVQCADKAENN